METNVVTGEIVGSAMRVHTALGPGLLESVYRAALLHELRKHGLKAVPEKPIRIHYDGVDPLNLLARSECSFCGFSSPIGRVTNCAY